MEISRHLGRSPVVVIAIAVFTVALIVRRIQRYVIHRTIARQHGCKPVAHTINKDPIWGLDVAVEQIKYAKAHKTLENNLHRFETLGHTFKTNSFGSPVILTREPENIKTVLAINFKDYGIGHRLKTFRPLLGEGIFDTDGEHWAFSRALVRPNFTRDQVADLEAFEALIPDFLALIPRDGQTTVDLQDIFFRYTIDSATDFLFGESVGSLRDQSDLEKAAGLGFATAFNGAQDAVRRRGMLGPLLSKVMPDKKGDECTVFCREFASRFVDRAVAAVQAQEKDVEISMGRSKYVFSHELAKRTTDKVRILDELMNILLAGRDTTASLLSNMFFVLARRPDIWRKLRNEIATLEGRLPTYEELRNLKYLKYCLNESLRIHPVVPLNRRQALKDTVLPLGGGPDGQSPILVPKGTFVGYSVYAMHRRQDFYGPDAYEFRPERWETLQPRWEYLPFNGGPRICVGQQYALTEAAYVTVRMAQEFSELETRDPGPWEENLTLTMCSRNGTKVCLKPA